MEKQIDTLINLGSDAAQVAIDDYTQWYIASSLCWIAFGVFLIVMARIVWLRLDNSENDDVKSFVSLLFAFMGVTLIFMMIPTLISPRAKAISRLIEGMRP